MTAASEQAAPGRERADTYLRLVAEAELRRALAMPACKPPRGPMAFAILNPVIQHRRRQMRRRRARIDRMMRQQARRTGQAIRAAAWHVRTRLPWLFHDGGHESPPAHACAERVTALAAILAAVGAISAQTEAEVTSNFAAALAARGRIERYALLGARRFGRPAMRRPASTYPAPAGPPRAHPVGISANGQVEGVPVRFYLGVLVIDQGSVMLTMQARFPAGQMGAGHSHMDPMFEALNEITAADDRGGTYRAHFSGGGGDGEWDGQLHLSPAPPAGVRWLDMTLPASPVVRVPMDTPPADLPVRMETVTATAADRFLDAQTAWLMLASAPDAARILTGDETTQLRGIAADLLGAGVLSTSSGSLRRLAGVAAHVGVRLPGSLAAIEPASLPADWLSLTAKAGRPEGTTGVIPVAAVLPEIDGALCVIGELVSGPDSSTLRVHARGWPEPRHEDGVHAEQFSWTARDDLGGWYLLGAGGQSYSGGEADLDLQVSPAINPRARALDIVLTGPATQVTVTVPLDWQEDS